MVEEFKFQSTVGKEIYAKKWFDENRTKYEGVVQLVHGMQEHIGKYEEFASFLAKCGYIVVGHDHLGHGKTANTEEELGYFTKENGWQRLLEDIHILQNKIQTQYKQIPYIMLGHSMGSLLTRTYVTTYQDKIDGIILSGTSGQKTGLLIGKVLAKLIILLKGPKYKSKLVASLVMGSFHRKFSSKQTVGNWTTSDETVIAKQKQDTTPKCKFTVSAYYELFYGTSYANKKKTITKTPNIPILIFSGEKDPVGGKDGKGVRSVYDRLKKAGRDKITFKLFPNGRHEMLNEINRQEVFKFVLEWIRSQI